MLIIIVLFKKFVLEEFFFKVVFCLVDCVFGILTKVRLIAGLVLTFVRIPACAIFGARVLTCKITD